MRCHRCHCQHLVHIVRNCQAPAPAPKPAENRQTSVVASSVLEGDARDATMSNFNAIQDQNGWASTEDGKSILSPADTSSEATSTSRANTYQHRDQRRQAKASALSLSVVRPRGSGGKMCRCLLSPLFTC